MVISRRRFAENLNEMHGIKKKHVKGVQNFCFWQLSMQILWRRCCSRVVDLKLPIRELKQPRRRQQQKSHIFAYFTRLHVHFSSFDILKTFSFFLRREMTCSAVVWTTWAHDDKCSILFSYVPRAGYNLIPGQLEHTFQA